MLTGTLSSKGQLAIPKEIRDRLDLRRGVKLAFRVEGRSVVLQKADRRDWRRWEGAFSGLDLMADRARLRRQELKRDARKVKG